MDFQCHIQSKLSIQCLSIYFLLYKGLQTKTIQKPKKNFRGARLEFFTKVDQKVRKVRIILKIQSEKSWNFFYFGLRLNSGNHIPYITQLFVARIKVYQSLSYLVLSCLSCLYIPLHAVSSMTDKFLFNSAGNCKVSLHCIVYKLCINLWRAQ